MTRVFALLIGGILVIIMANNSASKKPEQVVEDTWAKQSASEMKLAAIDIVRVNHCSLAASLMTDQDRTEAKARVSLAIEKFGEYDVGQRAIQLHNYLIVEKKKAEFCAVGVWDKQ